MHQSLQDCNGSTNVADLENEMEILSKTPIKKSISDSDGGISPTTPSLPKRRLRSCSSPLASARSVEMDLSREQLLDQRLQELMELQQFPTEENESLVELQYLDMDAILDEKWTTEEMESKCLVIQLSPEGQFLYFLLEGWAPFPFMESTIADFMPPKKPSSLQISKQRDLDVFFMSP